MKILTWEARSNAKLSLRSLEELTGIGKTTLNDIENGKVSPTLWELEQIAKATKCSITDLFESDFK